MRFRAVATVVRPGRLGAASRAVCVAAVLAGCAAAPAAAQPPPQPFITGVGTHFGQHDTNAAQTFALAAQAGIDSIRDEIGWAWVEGRRGEFAMPERFDHYVEEAVRAGLSPLLVLDYGNQLYDGGDKPRSAEAVAAFARYAAFVARHFQGKVRRYEVWNEWDNGIGGTTPGSVDDYAPLLRAVYAALKSVDPDIEVLADAVVMGQRHDDDFRKMAQLDLLRFADGISFHPYFYNRGPKKTPEAWADWMREIEASLRRANRDAAVPLYITEIGWPTNWGGNGVSLVREAAYAVRLLLVSRTMPFIKGVWWYDFRNDGQNPRSEYDNFGLLWPDLTPKPGYYALVDITNALKGAAMIERKDLHDGDDWLLRFRLPDGRELWAVWTARDDALTRLELKTTTQNPEPLELHEVGRLPVNRSWSRDLWGNWRLQVTVGEMPLLLRSSALSQADVDVVAHPEFPSERR
jgi:hypothetical protein